MIMELGTFVQGHKATTTQETNTVFTLDQTANSHMHV